MTKKTRFQPIAAEPLRLPTWTRHPTTLQLDTHNSCNLHCAYCNVQHSFNLPRGTMPLSLIKKVLAFWSGRGPSKVAPFMNGEPLLERRLQRICTLAGQHGFSCVVDTNGSLYEHRKRLVHSNLRLVRFTISAATPETYLKVHGKPLFLDALDTFQWFSLNKLPSQQAWLHFICTKDNEHEVDLWSRMFKGTPQTIFPVHRGVGQHNSEAAMGSLDAPYMVDRYGVKRPCNPNPNSQVDPCPCWSILPVSWRGDIMQCVDFPYCYSWGRVGKADMAEAWRLRNWNMMDNPCCNTCSLRFSNYKQTLEKYVK